MKLILIEMQMLIKSTHNLVVCTYVHISLRYLDSILMMFVFVFTQLAKSENEELQVEIDQMKFAATDPLKKGNSIFAELEDNRKMMEKQVISLNSKFETCKKHCDIKTRQIAKLKVRKKRFKKYNFYLGAIIKCCLKDYRHHPINQSSSHRMWE